MYLDRSAGLALFLCNVFMGPAARKRQMFLSVLRGFLFGLSSVLFGLCQGVIWARDNLRTEGQTTALETGFVTEKGALFGCGLLLFLLPSSLTNSTIMMM